MDSDHHMQMKHLNIIHCLDLRVYFTMYLDLPLTFMHANYKPTMTTSLQFFLYLFLKYFV